MSGGYEQYMRDHNIPSEPQESEEEPRVEDHLQHDKPEAEE